MVILVILVFRNIGRSPGLSNVTKNQNNQNNHLFLYVFQFAYQKYQKNHLNMCVFIEIDCFPLENKGFLVPQAPNQRVPPWAAAVNQRVPPWTVGLEPKGNGAV